MVAREVFQREARAASASHSSKTLAAIYDVGRGRGPSLPGAGALEGRPLREHTDKKLFWISGRSGV